MSFCCFCAFFCKMQFCPLRTPPPSDVGRFRFPTFYCRFLLAAEWDQGWFFILALSCIPTDDDDDDRDRDRNEDCVVWWCNAPRSVGNPQESIAARFAAIKKEEPHGNHFEGDCLVFLFIPFDCYRCCCCCLAKLWPTGSSIREFLQQISMIAYKLSQRHSVR